MFRVDISLRTTAESALDNTAIDALETALRTVLEDAGLIADERRFLSIRQSSSELR